MNGTFYKPGGPVFLMIGGEGEIDPTWMVVGQWINYAQEHHAMCLSPFSLIIDPPVCGKHLSVLRHPLAIFATIC